MTSTTSPHHLRRPSRADVARRTTHVLATAVHRLSVPAVRRVTRHGGPRSFPRALRTACDDLGATFIKVGQIVASAPSLTGDEVAAEFRGMLDAGPPVPFADVVGQIERATGAAVQTHFAHIDPDPIGQASLAVVHRGTLRDGRDVAIKVLRPGIERTLASDLTILRSLVKVLSLAVPAAGGLAARLVDDLAEQLERELDLRNEAASMARFRALPQHDQLPLVVVPEPLLELSGRRVLVMDFLDGVPIDDSDIEALELDAAELVDQLVKAWMLTALRDGIFHGDLHAGNILLLRDGRVGLIDWGIVGHLEPDAHWLLRRFIGGAVGDETAWDELADHLATTVATLDPGTSLDRTMLRMVLRDHLGAVVNRPFGEFSLSETLMAITTQANALRGETPNPSTRGLAGALRRSRQPGPDLRVMDGGLLLLAKQLAYVERYGRLHLREGDRPVLHDQRFFRDVLGLEPPQPTDRPGASID